MTLSNAIDAESVEQWKSCLGRKCSSAMAFQITSPDHPVVKCFDPYQSDDLLIKINKYKVSRRAKRITASNISLMAKGQVSVAS